MEITNNQNNTCDHVWLGVGLRDGKTPDGRPTGGIVFKCQKCGDEATSQQQIREKGGRIDWENSKYKAAGWNKTS